MTFLVRQLAPTPQGVPMEIYCFSGEQRWIQYEGIMGDIFDHLLAVARELERRMISLFETNRQGDRPAHGGEQRYSQDPAWKDLILFYE